MCSSPGWFEGDPHGSVAVCLIRRMAAFQEWNGATGGKAVRRGLSAGQAIPRLGPISGISKNTQLVTVTLGSQSASTERLVPLADAIDEQGDGGGDLTGATSQRSGFPLA